MKTVIINGKFLTQRVTGVQRYAREIVTELDKQLNNELELSVIIAVPKDASDVPDYKNIEVVKAGHLKGIVWEQISLPLYAAGKGTLLNLCNVSPLISLGIVAVHDVKIKARPQDFSRKFLIWYNLLFKNSTKRAKEIITVSEFSKREIIKYYKVVPEKIAVIPDAWQHYERIGYDDNALEKYGLKNDSYYFSMCSLEPNKNFKWIAEAAKRNPDQVFAVSGSINETVFADGSGFECPENMKLLGYVSDEEAKTLMRDCKAFLFPTFYEGFGIPPLEAISAGARQVVVSDTEVMHEIFGDSVVYVDPMDYEIDLEKCKAERVIDMSKYSWSKSAEMLLIELRKIGGGYEYLVNINRLYDETLISAYGCAA